MPKGPGICGETPSKSSEGGQGLGEGMGSPGAGVEEEAAPGLQKAPRKRCCPRWLGGQRSQPPLLYGGWAGGERMPSSRPSQVSWKVILYDRPAASLLWFLSLQPGPWGLCWELGLGHSSPSHCPGPFPSQGPVHATSSTGGQLPVTPTQSLEVSSSVSEWLCNCLRWGHLLSSQLLPALSSGPDTAGWALASPG